MIDEAVLRAKAKDLRGAVGPVDVPAALAATLERRRTGPPRVLVAALAAMLLAVASVGVVLHLDGESDVVLRDRSEPIRLLPAAGDGFRVVEVRTTEPTPALHRPDPAAQVVLGELVGPVLGRAVSVVAYRSQEDLTAGFPLGDAETVRVGALPAKLVETSAGRRSLTWWTPDRLAVQVDARGLSRTELVRFSDGLHVQADGERAPRISWDALPSGLSVLATPDPVVPRSAGATVVVTDSSARRFEVETVAGWDRDPYTLAWQFPETRFVLLRGVRAVVGSGGGLPTTVAWVEDGTAVAVRSVEADVPASEVLRVVDRLRRVPSDEWTARTLDVPNRGGTRPRGSVVRSEAIDGVAVANTPLEVTAYVTSTGGRCVRIGTSSGAPIGESCRYGDGPWVASAWVDGGVIVFGVPVAGVAAVDVEESLDGRPLAEADRRAAGHLGFDVVVAFVADRVPAQLSVVARDADGREVGREAIFP